MSLTIFRKARILRLYKIGLMIEFKPQRHADITVNAFGTSGKMNDKKKGAVHTSKHPNKSPTKVIVLPSFLPIT